MTQALGSYATVSAGLRGGTLTRAETRKSLFGKTAYVLRTAYVFNSPPAKFHVLASLLFGDLKGSLALARIADVLSAIGILSAVKIGGLQGNKA